MALLNWQLFDRLRAFTRKANIFRHENLYQDQAALERTIQNGNFIEFSKQSGLLEQTNLQINRLERYKDYDMMDEVGEVTLALDIYADESSLIDPEKKHSVIVKSKSKKVKETVEDFLYNTLMIDSQIRPLIRYLCKYGDFAAEIVPTKHRDGVASFRYINIYNFTRVQTKYGDLVGFFYQDPNTLMPVFLHPWQVMHLRLTSFEQIYHPYGRSILDGVRKDFKRLRLMEDAALIYRITRAPEKRIFSIPVGNIPASQISAFITEIARNFKKHKFVDPATGQVNERYSPLIQEDDFFLPKRPDGSGPEVTTLPGAQNLDEIEDILYFKKKIIAGLKIPFSRVGIGDQSDSDGKSVSSVAPEFAKAIQYIQREVVTGLKKLVIVHLSLQGFTIQEIKDFDLMMTAASAIDELYRTETWMTRAEIISALKDTGMFPNEWILESFTTLTRDEIDQMQKEQRLKEEAGGLKGPDEAGAGGEDEEGGGMGDILSLGEAVDEQDKKLISEYYTSLAKTILEEKFPNVNLDIITEQREGPRFVSNQRRDGASNTASVQWLVNNNELDQLPLIGEEVNDVKKKEEILVESHVPIADAKEVIDQIKSLLLIESAGVETAIAEIADAIDTVPNKNLINEDVSSIIEDNDLPAKII